MEPNHEITTIFFYPHESNFLTAKIIKHQFAYWHVTSWKICKRIKKDVPTTHSTRYLSPEAAGELLKDLFSFVFKATFNNITGPANSIFTQSYFIWTNKEKKRKKKRKKGKQISIHQRRERFKWKIQITFNINPRISQFISTIVTLAK